MEGLFLARMAASGCGLKCSGIQHARITGHSAWLHCCGAPHCFVGNGVKVFCIERGYVVTLFRGLQTEIVPEVLTDRVKEPNRRGASVVERF